MVTGRRTRCAGRGTHRAANGFGTDGRARPGPIVAPAAGTAVAALRLPATALVAGHGIAVVIG